jgi:tRNA threonylcarbamoyladenosine biosynthesis protein TsaE
MSTLDEQKNLIRIKNINLNGLHRVSGQIAGLLEPGLLIGLSGPLGAGKTEFVRGVMMRLGSADSVSSPTYVLENFYEPRGRGAGQTEVSHWDFYRTEQEFIPEEILDYRGSSDVVCLIEWPEKIEEVMDLLSMHICIGFATNSDRRNLEINVACRKLFAQLKAVLADCQSIEAEILEGHERS